MVPKKSQEKELGLDRGRAQDKDSGGGKRRGRKVGKRERLSSPS